MSTKSIKNFYSSAIEQKKFSPEFWNELRKISTESELKSFIEGKVQPVAKKMGYVFSTAELLSYEEKVAKEITERQLEAVSGGVDVKNLALGGIISLMAIGAGVVGATSSASAELSTKEISGSSTTLETEIDKEIKVTKITEESKEDKKSDQEQDDKGENGQKELENTDLKKVKKASKVDQSKIVETKKLTDEQKLYALEHLNLQEPFAFLQSGGIENFRFNGNASDLELDENGNRVYTADHGDAFTELLYMLYPSNAGNLNVAGGGVRENFSKFGGIDSKLMAKFCAILNDYRNGKISIKNKNDKIYFPLEKKQRQIQVNNAKEAVGNLAKFLKHYGFTDEDLIQKITVLKNNKEESKVSFAKASLYGNFIENMFNCIEMEASDDIENKIKTLESEIAKSEKTLEKLKQNKQDKSAKITENEINKKKEQIQNLKINYPKYLTERILMSYMIKTLNTEKDVENLYKNIATELSKNETNKTSAEESKKEEIAEKIKAKKQKIESLNEIIGNAKIQELSPYKTATQSNDTTYVIGAPDNDGNVQFSQKTFADCADITVRHVVNLLTYSNDKSWDSILKDANIENLNGKLKEVVDAINSKSKVKFYDLKTRLQMFFLYQRGFINGKDNDADINYRSSNGADNVDSLARTLWEYAICNMDKGNLAKGPDKDNKFYEIGYNQNNIELLPGYINTLKLMWNMAKSLNLGAEIAGEKTKLDLAKDKIDNLVSLAKESKHSDVALMDALNLIFTLFHTDKNISIEIDSKAGLKIDERRDITNKSGNQVLVSINKDEEVLSFFINQSSGHAGVTYNPIKFNWDEKFADQDYSFDEAKLLLRSFTKGSDNEDKITPAQGFYGAYSKEKLENGDQFIKKDLYKKYKALSAYKALWNETTNYDRIQELLASPAARTGAKMIKIKQNSKDTEKNLNDIFYERLLNPNEVSFDNKNVKTAIYNYEKSKFGEIKDAYYINSENNKHEEISNFEVVKLSKDSDRVKLSIKSIPNDGKLIIPSEVYDKSTNNLFKVESVVKSSGIKLGDLKTVRFVGDFDNLKIMQRTFSDTEKLEKVEFMGEIKNLTVGIRSFFNCKNLKATEIKNVNNLTIKESAFKGCDNLKTFVIPEGVTNLTLENYSFDDCDKLDNLIIPDSVKTLDISPYFIKVNTFCGKVILPKRLKSDNLKESEDEGKVIYYEKNEDKLVLSVKDNDKKEARFSEKELKTLIEIAKSKGINADKIKAKNGTEEDMKISCYLPKELENNIDKEIKSYASFYNVEPNLFEKHRLTLTIKDETIKLSEFILNKSLLEQYARKVGENIDDIQIVQVQVEKDYEYINVKVKLADDLKYRLEKDVYIWKDILDFYNQEKIVVLANAHPLEIDDNVEGGTLYLKLSENIDSFILDDGTLFYKDYIEGDFGIDRALRRDIKRIQALNSKGKTVKIDYFGNFNKEFEKAEDGSLVRKE